MYQQYFDDFYRKTQYRLLKLGAKMALDYSRGEQYFREEVLECRDLRRARRVLTSIGLTERQKYDFVLKVIDCYRLDEGLNIDLSFLCIYTNEEPGSGGVGTGGLIKHNDTLDKDAGDPVNNYFGHLTKDEIDWIKAQRFQAPSINYPNANFGSVTNVDTAIPNDGAEKNTTFNYSIGVTISPNNGLIQSIKVFRTTGGIENPTPIITTLGLSFTINDSLTDTTSYRLELKYSNTTGGNITVNVVRAVNFYYPTYIGVGASGLDETTVKATLEKHIWANANRTRIKFNVNNNKMYFIEKSGNTRRIIDVAINYTNSFTYTLVDYTFGSTVQMKVAEFNNALVPGVYDFDFLLI